MEEILDNLTDRIAEAEREGTELDRVRGAYNTVRLHASIGYVTPDDQHEGRGEAIRANRRYGLAQARENRIAYRRNTTQEK